jgi:uncharacterized membrane protein YeiB
MGSAFVLGGLALFTTIPTVDVLPSPGPGLELVKLYSDQALALFYICLVVLLLQSNMLKRISQPVADVGQLALSNYFLHDFIGTTVFFGYGFGLHGKLGWTLGKVLAVLACGFLMVISSWWVRRFEFGPAEWLWRCATYLKVPRLRRPPEEYKAALA